MFLALLLTIGLISLVAAEAFIFAQWPQWVEDEFAIDPNDPWVRDERHRALGFSRGS